jgi:hypothetical protein
MLHYITIIGNRAFVLSAHRHCRITQRRNITIKFLYVLQFIGLFFNYKKVNKKNEMLSNQVTLNSH